MDSVEEMELEAYEEETLDMPLVDVSAIVPGRVIKEEKASLKRLFGTFQWHTGDCQTYRLQEGRSAVFSQKRRRAIYLAGRRVTFYGKQRFCPVVAKQRCRSFQS